MTDVAQSEAYIRRKALELGVDPDIAVRVARAEGLQPGTWQSNASRNGRREPSYGEFQLLVGGGDTGFPVGLGNDFMTKTGLNPADPANRNAMIDFALGTAAREGWGKWMGAKAAGVGNMTGIGGSGLAAMMAPAPTAEGIAPAFGDVLGQQIASDMPGLGLGFINQAEVRREEENAREQDRRRALFSQPLSGLYG
jgi:hypothetical protein